MDINKLTIPNHVAIILDGNGRWAKQHNVPRALGHKAGCETLKQILKDASALGIKYLTVYAFSTENWKRSEEEVSALMDLFRFYGKEIEEEANKHNARIKMIGDPQRFAPDIQDGIKRMMRNTAKNTGMTFIYAINYGGRDDLRRAFIKMMEKGVKTEEITEKMISDSLDTFDIPDPDLMIRTSGELRISNFLLWQLAYSELYVTDTYWPDFNKEELIKAIESYNKRDRRFGGR